MDDRTRQLLEHAKVRFKANMSLIKWGAARWMQYKGYSFDEERDLVTFNFESSTYGIGFKIKVKAFSAIYGKPSYIDYGEAYDYFREVKYTECSA